MNLQHAEPNFAQQEPSGAIQIREEIALPEVASEISGREQTHRENEISGNADSVIDTRAAGNELVGNIEDSNTFGDIASNTGRAEVQSDNQALNTEPHVLPIDHQAMPAWPNVEPAEAQAGAVELQTGAVEPQAGPVEQQAEDIEQQAVIDIPDDASSESGSNSVPNSIPASPLRPQESTPVKTKSTSASVPGSPESDDEGQICPICFEPWSNSGDHRLASLKCGHIFGSMCIERWLKGAGGKCPQCNAKATKKDIRILYAKALKMIDTSERDRVAKELKVEKEKKGKLELEHAKVKMKCEQRGMQISQLQEELRKLRSACASGGGNLFLSQALNSSTMGSSTSGDIKKKLILHTTIEISKDGGCRVMAFNEWLAMLIVSVPSQVAMFPGCGLKKVNILDMKSERYVPCHQKQIRDLDFNPAKNDLLLSVAMDKQVKITNICSNTSVQSFTTGYPLWSCCWNTDNANQFFVGTSAGSVIQFDTRNTSGPVQTIQVAGQGPVVSLCYIPQSQGSKFKLGGLLVGRLQSCSFVEVKEDGIKDYPLLLEGPFASFSFERTTRHILVTCRPSQKSPHARHLICELTTVNLSTDVGSAPNIVVSANIVNTFRGGTTQKVLSRTCLIPSPMNSDTALACCNDESTQSVFIWDIATGGCVQQIRINDNVVDVAHIRSNQDSYLTLLTDKVLKVYKWIEIL
ncbi:unnamed protein product [Meganyctiphanes norvegica]|uniref:RING-type E3 ubiquitin transferase n=1 Tax=Meganyctiphanes norvegica TaxID=48144 RepID=A0AAV2RVL8_MEGNR